MSGLVLSKREKRLRIWNGMTPAQRDYDRFVARQIPQGATWGAETEGGRQMEAERWRLMEEGEGEGACSCHRCAPCSRCMNQPDPDEAASAAEGRGDE